MVVIMSQNIIISLHAAFNTTAQILNVIFEWSALMLHG